MRPGDGLGVECRFDNTAGNQPTVGGVRRKVGDVYWGVRAVDEMCTGDLYLSGRVRGGFNSKAFAARVEALVRALRSP